MSLVEAPLKDPVVDESRVCRPSWADFYSSLSRGDVGTTWTPVFANLGQTGTPTITGVYYQNQGFTDFYVKIVPGTNTSSVLGTTSFILPFTVTADTGCDAIAGVSAVRGSVSASSKTVYPPTWTNVTVPITISGRVKN